MGQQKANRVQSKNSNYDIEIDPQLRCYRRDNYDLESLRPQALAWFIQFAIRADFVAANAQMQDGYTRANVLLGYAEIHESRDQIRQLIRDRHVVDEPGLNSIGLSLYNFPTLSRFFVAPNKQDFVREATVREIELALASTRNRIRSSDLAQLIPSQEADTDSFGATDVLVSNMTPSGVSTEADLDPAHEKLFVIDAAAPMDILVQQFEIAVGKIKSRRSPIEPYFEDWGKYGVLPYVDLFDWLTAAPDISVNNNIQSEIVLPEFLIYTDLQKHTKRSAKLLLNPESELFNRLKNAASSSFKAMLAQIRQHNFDANRPLHLALQRWFPFTYPVNLPDLQRLPSIFPGTRDVVLSLFQEFGRERLLNMGIRERIATYSSDNDDGLGMIKAMRSFMGKAEE
jgi:hypothetical protein